MEKLVETSRGTVNIKVTGNLDDDKRVIVLVPGVLGSTEYYESITPLLSDKYIVVTADLLGQGKSSQSNDKEYDIDMEAWAILEALAMVPITSQLVLFGYGISGLVVANMAELRGISVDKIILMNTPANAKHAEISSSRRVSLFSKGVKSHSYFAKNFDESKLTNPKLIEEAASQTDRRDVKKLDKMGVDYLEKKALNRRLREIYLPTLAIFSDEDQILGEEGIADSKASIGRVPKLKIVDIKGVGHAAFLEKPEEIVDIIKKFDEETKDDNK
ncbi:alpha/beta fold hydrolase [Lactobacillus terrae]|uniref:alpha/beta fold hydrolase n=1 Tax=Lactobacillus terrae TaxID=2269374 RepID=UPI000C1B76BA|nr:alpha/beta hydrolase [Lactobacillus terrae]